MKKRLLLLLFIIVSFSAFSQVTYLADTAFTTDEGYDGAQASCVFTGGRYTGFYMDNLVGFSLADVFSVPSSGPWTFDTVILYGFKTWNSTISPFTEVYLQIYQDGPPGVSGTVIWGDTVTNLLVSTGFTGIYRVDTFSASGGIMGNQWPIMYLKLFLSPAPILPAGNYWLRWSAKANGTGRIQCPPKVLPGRVNPPLQQARQDSSGTWYVLEDNTYEVGFNKIIKASATVSVPAINALPGLSLAQNSPNPFAGTTDISFFLPHNGVATLAVYNWVGQLVTTLYNEDAKAGEHHVGFIAGNLPAGAYYYRLSTADGVVTKVMVAGK